MTERKIEKRAVRLRMAETGEKYTAARRALLEPKTEDYELGRLVRPGNVIAIVNGGGATNLALAMPVLARHLEGGGHLVVAQLGDDGWAMPGAPDLVVGRGIATIEEVRGWIEDEHEHEHELRQAVEAATPRVQVVGGLVPEQLAAALELGPNPLLYVQDIQTDPPLRPLAVADPPDEFAHVPENVRAIRRVIEETKATAIVCHCIPADDIQSWEPLAKVSDYTLAIEDDYMRRVVGGDKGLVEVTVDVFDSEGELGSYETTLDTRFLDWRQPR
jgi:hypothetical protein